MERNVVANLNVHSKNSCYRFSPEQMNRLQQDVAVSLALEPGLNIVKIKSGTFDYQHSSGHPGEPLVMLWIYGGKVINQQTGIVVGATWSSLNGYDDSLVLDVKEKATLCAFFFDTHLGDNDGEVQLSIARI